VVAELLTGPVIHEGTAGAEFRAESHADRPGREALRGPFVLPPPEAAIRVRV